MDPSFIHSKLIPTTADSVFNKICQEKGKFAESILKKYDRKELDVIEEQKEDLMHYSESFNEA